MLSRSFPAPVMDYDATMPPQPGADRSRSDNWGAITTVTRVKRGRLWLLKLNFWIGRKTNLFVAPLFRMRVIAHARWTLMPPGPRGHVLVFETNWSGPHESYIPDFAQVMQVQWKSMFDNVVGYPGPVPNTRMVEYVDEVDKGTDHYWSDYDARATTQVIEASLALQGSFKRFVAQTRGLPPDLLLARWRRFASQVAAARPAVGALAALRQRSRERALEIGEVVLLTPVAPGRAADLQDYLHGLRTRAGERSPFTMEPRRTHFARFVVITLETPQLLFTARFDGEERDYLERIAAVPQAREIFGYCERPRPLTEETLRAYLLEDREARVPVSYVLPWYEPDTVVSVNEAIELRARLVELALAAEQLDAIGFAHELRQLDAVRRQLAR